MDSAVAQSVAPGTYYLEVDGTGLADPTLGYSDYGSVGRYTLAVDGCPGTVHAATAPSAPVVVAVERDGAAQGLRLVWDEPADDGGAPVTSYVVTAGGQPVTVPATTHSDTLGGLAPSTDLHPGGGRGQRAPAPARWPAGPRRPGSFSEHPRRRRRPPTPTPTSTPTDDGRRRARRSDTDVPTPSTPTSHADRRPPTQRPADQRVRHRDADRAPPPTSYAVPAAPLGRRRSSAGRPAHPLTRPAVVAAAGLRPGGAPLTALRGGRRGRPGPTARSCATRTLPAPGRRRGI